MSTRSLMPRALGAIAAIGGLALVLASCSAAPSVTTAPVATTAPTTRPTTAPSASAAAVQPIADGRYVSGAQDVASIVARIKANTTLTAVQKADGIQGFNGHKTETVWLDFHGGKFMQLGAFDDDAPQVGVQAAPFAFPDSRTLVIQEQCCGISTFDITFGERSFSLKYKSHTPTDELDALIGPFVYESSPFTSADAAAQAIPDGTYVGATMQVADMIALINADTKLSSAQKTDLIDNAFEIRDHTTFAVSLDLHGGEWTERQGADGTSQVGQRATYAFPDRQTVVIEEQCCGITTFEVSWAQGSFTLKQIGAAPNEWDAMAGRILFELTPFTRAL
jgi:hypothetical protein